ncbi:MAG: hypothetical protein PHH70_01075 [Candidatus Gracilibacteria bacterium]|nr:hypothetical protein [Candidatus Gracilibacteria bacterium]
MNTSVPDWCSEQLSIKSGITRGHVGESNESIIQLITTSGASYRTSASDEHTFQSLVQQVIGDTLAEIRYSGTATLHEIRNSTNIGEWIKSRIGSTIGC